ncbi:hypothetical protein, partial [Mycolicibacterium sp. CBMA 361]|uniref:hypothetical protein n=1 Tax=Mycolicibacterium sp. CBMA 361 TaxID=2606610 RepID=UPI00193E8966
LHDKGVGIVRRQQKFSVHVSDSSENHQRAHLQHGRIRRYLATLALLIMATALGCSSDDLKALPSPPGDTSTMHTCAP